MKSIRTIVVVSIGLIAALFWAVMSPRHEPEVGPPLSVSKELQCPGGSRVEGKLCMCPPGSAWDGGSCATASYDPNQPDNRHVTTVDLRRKIVPSAKH